MTKFWPLVLNIYLWRRLCTLELSCIFQFSKIQCLKSFDKVRCNSYTKVFILNVKFCSICGELDQKGKFPNISWCPKIWSLNLFGNSRDKSNTDFFIQILIFDLLVANQTFFKIKEIAKILWPRWYDVNRVNLYQNVIDY